MLSIKKVHSKINEKPVLSGLDLKVNAGEVHAIMGPNGSGKSTLASIISGNEAHEVTAGEILYFNQSLLTLSPEERARRGIFLSFQYPVEIPGVSVSNFIKTSVNELRKAQNKLPIKASELLKSMRTNLDLLNMSDDFLSRSINDGFSGGEKKRNEIFQMAMLKPKLAILDETDSGLDIDALKIVSKGVNKLRSKDNAFIIITHYQRLLNYIRPDYVHVLHGGKIVKSGSKNLALELEKEGYDNII